MTSGRILGSLGSNETAYRHRTKLRPEISRTVPGAELDERESQVEIIGHGLTDPYRIDEDVHASFPDQQDHSVDLVCGLDRGMDDRTDRGIDVDKVFRVIPGVRQEKEFSLAIDFTRNP